MDIDKPRIQEDCNTEACPTISSDTCQGTNCRIPADSVGNCKDSEFGCCADGKSFAEGPFRKGCPIPRSLTCHVRKIIFKCIIF